MNNVYTLRAVPDLYQQIYFPNEADVEVTDLFDARQRAETWKPLQARLYKGGRGDRKRLATDFPSLLPHIPVFTAKAVQALDEILRCNGELLPLQGPGLEVWAYNVTSCVGEECLNTGASEIVYFPDSTRVISVRRYVFHNHCCEYPPIFKICAFPFIRQHVFVNDEFKKAVEAAGLVGMRFVPSEISS